jgi:hypothetical protein
MVNPIDHDAPDAKHTPEVVVDQLVQLHPVLGVELDYIGL